MLQQKIKNNTGGNIKNHKNNINEDNNVSNNNKKINSNNKNKNDKNIKNNNNNKVFLVSKNKGPDAGHLYAMKVLKKATLKGYHFYLYH